VLARQVIKRFPRLIGDPSLLLNACAQFWLRLCSDAVDAELGASFGVCNFLGIHAELQVVI
jgi:hypothetical protein